MIERMEATYFGLLPTYLLLISFKTTTFLLLLSSNIGKVAELWTLVYDRFACSIPDPSSASVIVIGGFNTQNKVSRYSRAGLYCVLYCTVYCTVLCTVLQVRERGLARGPATAQCGEMVPWVWRLCVQW